MNRPEILIADEPTSDLDVQTELKIIGALQNVHQTGVTVLMVTHSLELIPYATRALRMEAGRLLPLEDGLEAQALPATFAEPKTGAATGQKPSGPLAWLRKPVHAAFVALGVSLAVLLVLAGLLIGRAGNEPAAAAAGTGAAGPGPVLGGGGMSGSNGTYDPSEYNLYGNTGLYASVTGGGWPYKIDPPLGDGFKPGRTQRHRQFRQRLRWRARRKDGADLLWEHESKRHDLQRRVPRAAHQAQTRREAQARTGQLPPGHRREKRSRLSEEPHRPGTLRA